MTYIGLGFMLLGICNGYLLWYILDYFVNGGTRLIILDRELWWEERVSYVHR